MKLIDRISNLVDQGVLGPEYVPTKDYWHWPVLKPEELEADFKEMYSTFGEIRWYGES